MTKEQRECNDAAERLRKALTGKQDKSECVNPLEDFLRGFQTKKEGDK